MKKKKKKKKPILTPELREQFARTMQLLEERIAYHEQKAAEQEHGGPQPQA